MQPAFIRVIDNIRKHLDQSPWRGTYRDVHVWPKGTKPEAKLRVMQLQRELETANSEEAADIQNALDHLPRPFPGYELCLHHHDQEVTVDLWQLCFEVCFSNYDRDQPSPDEAADAECVESEFVEIDTSLIDLDTGEVDWHQLDEKAKAIIGDVFTKLPTAG